MIGQAAANAPWRFASLPELGRHAGTAASLSSRVSTVPVTLVPAIEDDGLRAAPVEALKRLIVCAQLWLGAVPELEGLVLQVVRDIHPLAAKPGYDVSHSQPQWRETIFVSCPERDDDLGALRLAESIVHEAMHLHLTNEEVQAPLVAVPSEMAHSPWRDIDRPVQGVMHGLFVFACIHRFLQMLTIALPLVDDVHRYITRRLGTIAEELGQIDMQDLSRNLTPRGQAGVVSWIAGYRSDGMNA